MKNSLLAVMALCGATSSTLPLWASEKYPDPTLAFVDPDLEQSENGGGCTTSIMWLPKNL